MNTKFPLNGRYTTLGDIIHEYGPYSAWPTTKYNLESEVDGTMDSSILPFVEYLFSETNSDGTMKVKSPYEIVWFDRVYSEDEKEDSGKSMKVILESDASVFKCKSNNNIPGLGFASEVIALDTYDPDNIRNKGIYKFRFVIPKKFNNKDLFYYDYKTPDGEATVMYALRNIIKILKSNKKTENDIYKFFSYLFNDTDKIIINNELDKNAYKYLGSAVWTSKYVKFKNYMHDVSNNFKASDETKDEFPGTSLINKYLKYFKNNDYKYRDPNSPKDNESDYNKIIYYTQLFLNSQRYYTGFVTGFQFLKVSNKSYLQIEPVLRCDLGILLLIEKFEIVSAIHDWKTALPLGPLSGSTRMNFLINYKVKYKGIPQSPAVYTYILSVTFKDLREAANKENDNKDNTDYKDFIWYRMFALPGETYEVTEENKSNKEHYIYGAAEFPLVIEKNSVDILLNNTDVSISDCSLGVLAWPFNDRNLQVYSADELKLSVNNPTFRRDENDKPAGYADTYDLSTFISGNITADDAPGIAKDLIVGDSSKIAPFGKLRIHNVYDDFEDNANNSSFYVDVSIYRCKNYFYNTDEAISSDDAEATFYYEPRYRAVEPNTKISMAKMSVFEAGDATLDMTNINDTPDKLDAIWNDDTKIPKPLRYFTVPDINNFSFYITAETLTGLFRVYASGGREMRKDSTFKIFNNDLNVSLWGYNEDDNGWTNIQYVEQGVTSVENKSYFNLVRNNSEGFGSTVTVPQYQITINNINRNRIRYWKMKFSGIEYYFYFKMTTYKESNNTAVKTHKILIHPLYAADSLNSGTDLVEYNMTGNNEPESIHLNLLTYNKTTDIDGNLDKNNLNYLTISFNSDRIDDIININSNIYFKPTSVKVIDKTGIGTNKFIYQYNYQYNDSFVTGGRNPFNIAWEVKQYTGNDYKFVYNFKTDALFNTEGIGIDIAKLYTNQITNIYISFEPIYIIELGKITVPGDLDPTLGVGDMTNSGIQYIKYLGSNNKEGTIGGTIAGSTVVYGIFTHTVYIDDTCIILNGKTISNYIKDLVSKELEFEFNVNITVQNENNPYDLQLQNSITVTDANANSDGFNIDAKKELSYIRGNCHTVINIDFSKIGKIDPARKELLNVYLWIREGNTTSNVATNITQLKVAIIEMPADWKGDKSFTANPNKFYGHDTALPRNCKIRIICDIDKNKPYDDPDSWYRGMSVNSGSTITDHTYEMVLANAINVVAYTENPSERRVSVYLSVSPSSISGEGGTFIVTYYAKTDAGTIKPIDNEPNLEGDIIYIKGNKLRLDDNKTQIEYKVESKNTSDLPKSLKIDVEYDGKKSSQLTVTLETLTTQVVVDPIKNDLGLTVSTCKVGDTIIVTYYAKEGETIINDTNKISLAISPTTGYTASTTNNPESFSGGIEYKLTFSAATPNTSYTFTAKYNNKDSNVRTINITNSVIKAIITECPATCKPGNSIIIKYKGEKDGVTIDNKNEVTLSCSPSEHVTIEPKDNDGFVEAKVTFDNSVTAGTEFIFTAKYNSKDSDSRTVTITNSDIRASIEIDPTTYKPGETVTIKYYGYKDGSKETNPTKVTLSSDQSDMYTIDVAALDKIDNILLKITLKNSATGSITFKVVFEGAEATETITVTLELYNVYAYTDNLILPNTGGTFKIKYYALSLSTNNKIFDTNVTISFENNYSEDGETYEGITDLAEEGSSTQNPDELCRVITYKFGENTDSTKYTVFTAKYNGIESEPLIIKQLSVNTQILKAFDYMIITYEVYNEDGIEPVNIFGDVTDLTNLNKSGGNDLDINVRFTLNDNKQISITSIDDSKTIPLNYIDESGKFRTGICGGVGFYGNVCVKSSDSGINPTEKKPLIWRNYFAYSGDNTSYKGVETVYINMSEILNYKNEDNKGLAELGIKKIYIDLYAHWFAGRGGTGKVKAKYNTYLLNDKNTLPKLTFDENTHIIGPNSADENNVKDVSVIGIVATNAGHSGEDLLARLTYDVQHPENNTLDLVLKVMDPQYVDRTIRFAPSSVYARCNLTTIVSSNVSSNKEYTYDFSSTIYLTVKLYSNNKIESLSPYKKIDSTDKFTILETSGLNDTAKLENNILKFKIPADAINGNIYTIKISNPITAIDDTSFNLKFEVKE